MAESYELRNMIEAEQVEFAKALRGLTPEQWDTPSLCGKWTVHQAVMHIAWHSHTGDVERFGQPDDRIADKLAGTVPGDLAAAIGVDDGRPVDRSLMRLCASSGGIDRRVLQQ